MEQVVNEYWSAAAEGRFLVRHCKACGKAHYFPRTLCPLCLSDRTEWVEGSGGGEVYSYSINNRANPPYAVAYVKIDEGPMLMTNIVGCRTEDVRVGQRVRVVFQPDAQGTARPFFAPVDNLSVLQR